MDVCSIQPLHCNPRNKERIYRGWKWLDKAQFFLNLQNEGILRGVFQNFNPLCGRNPIENGS